MHFKLNCIQFLQDEQVISSERGIKQKRQRSSSSACWLLYRPPLHYCLSCNFLSSGYHLIMEISSCVEHLARLESNVYQHAMDTGLVLPAAYLTRHSSPLSRLWCVMMCTAFINSSSFSHWFYIIRTFRLALNQCWRSTRGTTSLIVRHNSIHLSLFKNLTLFPATVGRIWLRTHSHVTSH